MTDRRAALDEVHQSMHEEYHGTMARNEMIRLAREAGASPLHGGEVALFGAAAIERFAELVAAAEREQCAKLCEEIADSNETDGYYEWVTGNMECAAAIRHRVDVANCR